MSNSNKIFLYLIGLIFLIAGTATALEMINISFSSVVLLIIGAFFLLAYKKIRNNIFKYLSCFFIPIGIAYFIISSFQITETTNFLLIYFSLACAFLCLYLTSKRKLFLYIALGVALFALHVFTNATPGMSEYVFGYDCFYFATLCIVLFVFENISLGYVPLGISFIAYLCGILNLLNSSNLISPTLYKLLISLVFVLIGIVILGYSFIKSNNDKKENLHE